MPSRTGGSPLDRRRRRRCGCGSPRPRTGPRGQARVCSASRGTSPRSAVRPSPCRSPIDRVKLLATLTLLTVDRNSGAPIPSSARMLGVAVADRRTRERAARRQLITSTARAIAEREGWDAITTRRLAAEIEYSQPVIYKHVASMDEVVDAVALEGFGELAQVLARARTAGDAKGSLGRVAHAYSTFAAENPTLYDAMFTRPTRLHFAAEDTADEMSAG